MIEDPHHLLFQGRHPAGEMGHGIDVLLEDVLLDGASNLRVMSHWLWALVHLVLPAA